MLQTTDNKALSIQTTKNKKNQDILSGTTRVDGGKVSRNIENLSIVVNLAKSKKPQLAKSKKLDLLKVKANSSKTDFLTSKAQKTFIYLQKTFIKALIFRCFDPKYHIKIETDASKYAIGWVLNKMTLNYLDQFFCNYITHKNLEPIFFKSKVGQ